MPRRSSLARAEADQRGLAIAHFDAGRQHRFARDERDLDRERGVLGRDARDVRIERPVEIEV